MGAGQSAAEMAARKRAQARKLEDDALKWEQGAAGERQVGAILDRLPADHAVFHDLRVPGSKANVDHLVVGPGGVFAIDTKKFSYPVTRGRGRGADKLWTGRRPIRLDPCRWEASEVERRIGVPVSATMCIIAPSIPDGSFVFDGIRICEPSRLIREVSMTTFGPTSIDVASVVARVVEEFGASPEVRPGPTAERQQASSPSAQPAGAALSSAKPAPIVRRPWIVPAAKVAALLLILGLAPKLAVLAGQAGAAGSEILAERLVPTTVPSTSPPPTLPTTSSPASPPPTTIGFASPPAVPIEATCRNPGTGWVLSFGWPGPLPAGVSAYSVRWQLNGGSIIRHDIGGWSDPSKDLVEMRIPNGAEQMFFTDYLDSDEAILATTERAFEVSGDC